jgi:membrane-associated phospholipid phosphatase
MSDTAEADTTRSRPAALLAGGCAAGLVFVYLAGAHTHLGRVADRRAVPRPSEAFDPWTTALRIFEAMDASVAVLATLALVAIALLRRRPCVAALTAALVLGSAGAAYVLKRTLRHVERIGDHDLGFIPSYPSAHATTTLALGLGLVLVAGPALRPLVASAATAVAATMGVSAIIIHAHRPSDIIGAYLLATGAGAALTLTRRLPAVARELDREAGPRDATIARWLLRLGAAAIAAAPFVALIGTAIDDRVNGPLIAGWAVLCGGAALSVGAFVRVVFARSTPVSEG